MDSPFTLVNDILNMLLCRLKEVTANREACQFMLNVAERMQGVLHQFEEKQVEDSIETTLILLTEALIEAQDVVEKSCSAGFISSMLYHEDFALTLTKISAKVEDALFHIPITSLETNVALGFDIFTLVHLVHHVKFEKLAATSDRIMALKNILETAFHNDCRGPQDLKKIVAELSNEHLMSKEELDAGLEVLKIEASNAKKSQNTQREFECNALIQVLSKTQYDASGSQDQSQEKSQKLEDCLRCPISDEIMTDPVILKETGMTYNRSSIEEWFKSGHDRDPLTNVRLESKELMPNFALRAACLTVLDELEKSSSFLNNPSMSKDKNESYQTLMNAQQKIIDTYLNINSQEGNRWTLLHMASQKNLVDVAKYLIANGANIDLQEKNGWTSLHIAAQENSVEVAKELIAHGANIDLQEKDGASPLYIASQTNSLDIAKELITYGANVHLQQKDGWTPLHIAAQMNSIDVAKELIAHGAIIDLLQKDGASPLYIASEYNSLDIAKELIAYGANVHLQQKDGWTPLHIAAQMNSIDVAKELIARGANIALRDKNGSSPLYFASFNNSLDIAKELITYGANVHLQDKNGWTPLHIASQMNSIDVAKELIAHGANIDLQEKDGASPLHITSQNNCIEVTKELIAHGANIDLQQKDGRTPLHIASQMNSIDVVKELITNQPIIDLQDKDGWTPLHIGAECGRLEIVKILLEHGASRFIRNNRNETPLEVVCSIQLFGPYNDRIIAELMALL